MKTEYALHRPVHNTYLVRERSRDRWREVGVVLLCVLPLAVALLSYTWIHLEVVESGYQIVRLERELEELAEVEDRLGMEASELSSPARLERIATERLGLVHPRLDQVLFLEDPEVRRPQ